MTRLAPMAAAAAVLTLAGCGAHLEAPSDPGVCWHMVQTNDGGFRFNKLADHQPNLENCAARLEYMRLNFGRLGLREDQVIGAYQGQFLFLQREGVFTARNLETTRYLALVRTGDGRLAIPGAIKQQ
ncbi:MAG TPA: hypothetical protein VL358_14340 [Caulobacteraceae bacterium]|jgi:hypothetical protein|nr:hypothetical protein [Caulobacteraceae bacterium]